MKKYELNYKGGIIEIEANERYEYLINELQEKIAGAPPKELSKFYRFSDYWSSLMIWNAAGHLSIVEQSVATSPKRGRGFSGGTEMSTFRVVDEQRRLHTALSVPNIGFKWDQEVTIRKGVLEHGSTYLHRQPPAFETHSGWYLGPRGGSPSKNPEDYENMYCYDLIRQKPFLARFLGLPTGYMVIMQNNKVDDLVNGRNESIGDNLPKDIAMGDYYFQINPAICTSISSISAKPAGPAEQYLLEKVDLVITYPPPKAAFSSNEQYDSTRLPPTRLLFVFLHLRSQKSPRGYFWRHWIFACDTRQR